MTTEFYGANVGENNYEQSSGPYVNRQVMEPDCWPVDDNSGSGTKDQLAAGLHPVIAIGGRTAADGRPLNMTGTVIDYTAGLTTATGLARVNIADGFIVRNYVANVLTYSGVTPATFEQAPVVGQPVYVDDSAALGEGVTLSMSPLSGDGLRNPMAGVLMYCQDEYANSSVGGPNASATFDTSLSNSLVQQVYCVMQVNGARELA